MGACWDIQTPAIPGALAVIQIHARGEIGAVLGVLGLGETPIGRPMLRDLFGIDRAVVMRWSEDVAHVMPHGGPAVVRAVAAELERRGLTRMTRIDPRADYPEAEEEVEARMLHALARAASPLAVDLLLDQPRRWGGGGEADPEHSRLLNRLLDPPLVVAAGAPNVGKSSLVNALAGRSVSIVADQAGTTRDHVGVFIDMAGLVVRYVDTPGLGRSGDAVEAEAESIARRVIASADLVLACGDAGSRPPSVGPPGSTITVALRRDLGRPGWPHDAATSALTGEGIPALVALIRDRLVPPSVMADGRPWRFW